MIVAASNKEHQYLPHAQPLTPQNNRRCFQQCSHCAQLDYLEDHNLNMPSFQDTAYGANVKFKALSQKYTTFNPILHKQDDWEIHTCIHPWKSVPYTWYTETTAKDFLSTSLAQPRSELSLNLAGFFLCCIHLKQQSIIQLQPTHNNHNSQCAAMVAS